MTMTVEDVLAHHGVKGMKWGERRAAKKADKADAKWQKNIYSVHGAIDVHNRTADKINSDLPALNKKYKGVNLNKEMNLQGEGTTPQARQYLHEYNQLVAKHTAAAVREVHGTSPSGKYEAKLDTSDKNNWKVKVTPTKMQHGVDGMESMMPSPTSKAMEPELLMEVNHDDSGCITSHKKIKTPIAHQVDDLVDDILEHHGVKGMKWGQRGKGSHVSTEAKRTQQILDKSKSNTTKVKSLTNHELSQFNKRMEMERKFHQLKPEENKIKKGHSFVKGTIAGALAAGVTANSIYSFSKSPAGKMLKENLGKKSGKHFAK